MKNNMLQYRAFSDVHDINPGEVMILPTDTVYGLSCKAADAPAAQKIQQLKFRDTPKPLIVLIATMRDLDMFGIAVTQEHADFLKRVWPGPVSVIFKNISESFSHLTPDRTLAIRMPSRDDLRAFITRVGPIVSTSANHAGEVPATSAADAVAYFPEGVDAIVDTGACDSTPSTVVQILR
jgi:L-threonylcarbamoyladenylate synthase